MLKSQGGTTACGSGSFNMQDRKEVKK